MPWAAPALGDWADVLERGAADRAVAQSDVVYGAGGLSDTGWARDESVRRLVAASGDARRESRSGCRRPELEDGERGLPWGARLPACAGGLRSASAANRLREGAVRSDVHVAAFGASTRRNADRVASRSEHP